MRQLTKNEQERAQMLLQTELNNKLSTTLTEADFYPSWFYDVLRLAMKSESLISSRCSIDLFAKFCSGEKHLYSYKDCNTAINIIQSMTENEYIKGDNYGDDEITIIGIPYLEVIKEVTQMAVRLNEAAQFVINSIRKQIESRIEILGHVPDSLNSSIVGEA